MFKDQLIEYLVTHDQSALSFLSDNQLDGKDRDDFFSLLLKYRDDSVYAGVHKELYQSLHPDIKQVYDEIDKNYQAEDMTEIMQLNNFIQTLDVNLLKELADTHNSYYSSGLDVLMGKPEWPVVMKDIHKLSDLSLHTRYAKVIRLQLINRVMDNFIRTSHFVRTLTTPNRFFYEKMMDKMLEMYRDLSPEHALVMDDFVGKFDIEVLKTLKSMPHFTSTLLEPSTLIPLSIIQRQVKMKISKLDQISTYPFRSYLAYELSKKYPITNFDYKTFELVKNSNLLTTVFNDEEYAKQVSYERRIKDWQQGYGPRYNSRQYCDPSAVPAIALVSATTLEEARDVMDTFGNASYKHGNKNDLNVYTLKDPNRKSFILTGDMAEVASLWRSRYFMQYVLLLRHFNNVLIDEEVLWCLTHKTNTNIQAGATLFMDLMLDCKASLEVSVGINNAGRATVDYWQVKNKKNFYGSRLPTSLRDLLEEKYTLSYACYAVFKDTGE